MVLEHLSWAGKNLSWISTMFRYCLVEDCLLCLDGRSSLDGLVAMDEILKRV